MKSLKSVPSVFGAGLLVLLSFQAGATESGADAAAEGDFMTYETIDLNQLSQFCHEETGEMGQLLAGIKRQCDEVKVYCEGLSDAGAPSYQLMIAKSRLDTCDQVVKKIEKDIVGLRKKCSNILMEAFTRLSR